MFLGKHEIGLTIIITLNRQWYFLLICFIILCYTYNQEARIVSEKAYDVAKVDERVNRAVTAANRAANAARVAAVKAVQKQMQHNSSSAHMPIQIV